MSRIRQGFAFERELSRSFEHWKREGWDFYYWKIVDTNCYDYGTIYCNHCGGKNKSPFIAPEVIGDFIVFGDRGTVVVEAKSTGKEFFPLQNIKDGQIRTSLMINSYKSMDYFFAINDRRKRGHYRLFLISADDLDDIIADTTLKTKLPWDEIRPQSEELERMNGGLWDLKPFLRRIAVYRGKDGEERFIGMVKEYQRIRAREKEIQEFGDKGGKEIVPRGEDLWIRMIKDTPTFVSWAGTNVSYKNGDIVKIPRDFAHILVKEGFAELIDVSK